MTCSIVLRLVVGNLQVRLAREVVVATLGAVHMQCRLVCKGTRLTIDAASSREALRDIGKRTSSQKEMITMHQGVPNIYFPLHYSILF